VLLQSGWCNFSFLKTSLVQINSFDYLYASAQTFLKHTLFSHQKEPILIFTVEIARMWLLLASLSSTGRCYGNISMTGSFEPLARKRDLQMETEGSGRPVQRILPLEHGRPINGVFTSGMCFLTRSAAFDSLKFLSR